MNSEPDYYLKDKEKIKYYNTYNHINKIIKCKKENIPLNFKNSTELDISPFIKINNELLKLKKDINKNKEKKKHFHKETKRMHNIIFNNNYQKANFQDKNKDNEKYKFLEFKKKLEVLNETIKNKNKQFILFNSNNSINKEEYNSNGKYNEQNAHKDNEKNLSKDNNLETKNQFNIFDKTNAYINECNKINYENNPIECDELINNKIKNKIKKQNYFPNSSKKLKTKLNKEIIKNLIKEINFNNIDYLTYRYKSSNNILDNDENHKILNTLNEYETKKKRYGNGNIVSFLNKHKSLIKKDIKNKNVLNNNIYNNNNNFKEEIMNFAFFNYNKSNKNINNKIIDRYGDENNLITDNYNFFKKNKNIFQKTSFEIYIKSNNYLKNKYLNIIKELNIQIQKLENEIKHSKEALQKLIYTKKQFKILNIHYIDSFSYYETKKYNSYYQENNDNNKDNNAVENKLFFDSMNSMKKTYEFISDKITKKNSYIKIKNKFLLKSVIYKKKITKYNFTNNSFRQMSFDYNNNNYIKIENILNNISYNINYNKKINRYNTNQNNIIYCLYPYSIKKILSFSLTTKKFVLQEYIDTCSFKKNLIRNSFNEKSGNVYLNYNDYFYIITGLNYNMFYIYNQSNKTMKKLENLNFNHKNGNLVSFNDKIYCISGDYTKKVELYSKINNKWNIVSELNKTRTNFSSCIFKDKYLFVIFGFDAYSKEYINSIEYIDLIKNNSKWKYLNFENNVNFTSFFTDIIPIPINEDNLLLLGGFNSKTGINEYYKLNLKLLNTSPKKVLTIEKSNNKLFFNKKNNGNFIFDSNLYKYKDENNIILYSAFDQNLQVHIFIEKGYQHKIYNFN